MLTVGFDDARGLSDVVSMGTLQRLAILLPGVVHHLQLAGCLRAGHAEVTVRHAAVTWPVSLARPALSHPFLRTVGTGSGPVHALVWHEAVTGDDLLLRCQLQLVVCA